MDMFWISLDRGGSERIQGKTLERLEDLVMSMKKLEPLYTVADTAKILNVSEKTVRRLIRDKRLRVIGLRPGDNRRGSLRIDPTDLEDFIRDHRSR